MKGKFLLLAGGGLLLYLVSKAKAIKETVQYLEWIPSAIGIKFEGLTPVITVGMKIYNPNKTSVPVNGILGKIFYKGNPVASFTNSSPLTIDGNQTTSVSMNVRLSLFNAAVMLFTKDPSRKLEVEGLIKTSLTDMPFGYAYDFNSRLATKKNR